MNVVKRRYKVKFRLGKTISNMVKLITHLEADIIRLKQIQSKIKSDSIEECGKQIMQKYSEFAEKV